MPQRPKEKIWQSNQKVVMDEKSWKFWTSHQKIVMDEELVQNGVMNEKFVTNFVMNAKIDQKVVEWDELCPYSELVDGTVCNPTIKICWKNFLTRMNRGC